MAMLCVQTAFAYDFDNFNTKNHLVWSYFGGLAKFMVLTGDDAIGDEFIGKVGFIDQTGKVVIPPIYDDAHTFEYAGIGAVRKDDKWGFIDKTGKTVIDFHYDYVWGFQEGLVAVCRDGKWGFIDKTGKVVIPLQYDEVLIFQEGLAGVKVGHKWGYIDMSNNMVITPIYDNALNFNDGVSWVSLNDDDFVINKQGKPIK